MGPAVRHDARMSCCLLISRAVPPRVAVRANHQSQGPLAFAKQRTACPAFQCKKPKSNMILIVQENSRHSCRRFARTQGISFPLQLKMKINGCRPQVRLSADLGQHQAIGFLTFHDRSSFRILGPKLECRNPEFTLLSNHLHCLLDLIRFVQNRIAGDSQS